MHFTATALAHTHLRVPHLRAQRCRTPGSREARRRDSRLRCFAPQHSCHCPHYTRDREGRLLVECLIAALLVNTSALVVASLAVSVIGSAQQVRASTNAWAIALNTMEPAPRCAGLVASGALSRFNTRAQWTDVAVGVPPAARERRIELTLPASPLQHSPLRSAWTTQELRECAP